VLRNDIKGVIEQIDCACILAPKYSDEMNVFDVHEGSALVQVGINKFNKGAVLTPLMNILLKELSL